MSRPSPQIVVVHVAHPRLNQQSLAEEGFLQQVHNAPTEERGEHGVHAVVMKAERRATVVGLVAKAESATTDLNGRDMYGRHLETW
jgi:hypothetical protein